ADYVGRLSGSPCATIRPVEAWPGPSHAPRDTFRQPVPLWCGRVSRLSKPCSGQLCETHVVDLAGIEPASETAMPHFIEPVRCQRIGMAPSGVRTRTIPPGC